MPYTKRIPVHAGERGTGLYNCLEYVRNGDKTEDGILVNSLNCTVEFAEQEFLYIQRKYHKEMMIELPIMLFNHLIYEMI